MIFDKPWLCLTNRFEPRQTYLRIPANQAILFHPYYDSSTWFPTYTHTVTAVKKWQLFIISRHFYHCTVRSHLTLGHNDCCPQFFVHLYCFLIQMFTLIKSLFNILLLCKFFHHKYNMHDLIPFLYPPNTCQKLYISSILVVLNYNRTQNCKQL